MLKWLQVNHGRASVNKNERIKLNNLWEEVQQLRDEKEQLGNNVGDDHQDNNSDAPGSELQSDEDEDDDMVDDLPLNVI